jgi:hypothetical protein
MLRMRIDISGEVQYERGFAAMDAELEDLREPLGGVADLLKRAVGEQFLTEGEHGGLPWQPLSPAYAAEKEERYPGHPILVASGEMRDAFLVSGTRELSRERLVWGVTDQRDSHGDPISIRAAAHQSGEGVVPQRKIVALTNLDRRGIDREFASWLTHMRRRLLPGR